MLLLVLLLPDVAHSLTSFPLLNCSHEISRTCPSRKLSFPTCPAGTLRFRRWANHDRCHCHPLCLSKNTGDAEPENTKREKSPKYPKQTEDKISSNDESNNSKYGNRIVAKTSRKDEGAKSKRNILEMINPFKAGKSLRSSVKSAFDLASAITNDPASRLPPDRRAIYYNYYVDDQLGLSRSELKDDPKLDSSLTSSSSLLSPSSIDEDRRPEVLVVGASGVLGRILVKRLLLENKVRVRVLVRDLYSSTLNKLGTGVTYCQGTLNDIQSLEYAVTDVDKIVFCAGGKRPGEEDMHSGEHKEDGLKSILDQRAKEASEIDGDGLRNLIQAYLNVRHADYGTSFAGAAKRVLFKFQKRPADFGLFGIDDGSIDGNTGNLESDDLNNSSQDDTSGRGSVAANLSQCDWIRNKFGQGAFVGKVRRGGECAIASARLRSRNDPEQGIDLGSSGFSGLVCRVCSDGGVYEAFVRTETYSSLGVEYVCEFKAPSKPPATKNQSTSRTKFGTVRLEFSDFRPRMRQFQDQEDAQRMRQALAQRQIPPFFGDDIRQLGFRYRAKSNPSSWNKFYLALDYIKVYRRQYEPEFVYLSDARIPPVVNDAMVNHDLHRLVTASSSESSASYSIIDDKKTAKVIRDKMGSAEEVYFKYMGEEMIKQSGLR